MKRGLLAIALVLPFTALAVAQDATPTVTLGAPEYGGNGCPQGTATTAISPAGDVIAVLFDAYQVEAGGGARPLGRVTCQLAIPVAVPDGMSVAVFPVDFLGHNTLPEGATSTFNAEHFFAGGTGDIVETVVTGPADADFLARHVIAEDGLAWSECGADVILRTNSSIVLQNPGTTTATAVIEAAVGYRLQSRAC